MNVAKLSVTGTKAMMGATGQNRTPECSEKNGKDAHEEIPNGMRLGAPVTTEKMFPLPVESLQLEKPDWCVVRARGCHAQCGEIEKMDGGRQRKRKVNRP